MGIKTPKRGEIFLVNFDPTIGSEIEKTRTAVIIQNNIANEHSPIVIVAAISAQFEEDNLYPTEVYLDKTESGLDKNSVVLLNQIRSIDKQMLHKKLGKADKNTMKDIDKALQVSLGLIEL